MDKRIAGLLGAVSTLVMVDGASAATAPIPSTLPSPQSYADLLQPIPNAVALLAASDASTDAVTPRVRGVQVADHHHHHHHHHRRHYHHHHHHHDHG